MVKFVLAALLALLPVAGPAHAQRFAPTRFSVTVEGAGPDLILIPGLMSGRRVWDGAVASLGGRYRVHRVQIAGFAGEPARANAEGPLLAPLAEELHAYIEANRLRHPMVAGHSIGGLLALMLAARHPGDVSRALIVDALPFYGMLFGPGATAANVEPRAAAFRDAMLAMSPEAFRAQQPAMLATLIRNEAARPAVLDDVLASDRGVVARALYEDMVTDMRPALGAMRTPLTIAYALNPFATEERFGSLFRTGFAGAPDVRFVPVEPSHHFIMLDQPDRFHALLRECLEGASDDG